MRARRHIDNRKDGEHGGAEKNRKESPFSLPSFCIGLCFYSSLQRVCIFRFAARGISTNRDGMDSIEPILVLNWTRERVVFWIFHLAAAAMPTGDLWPEKQYRPMRGFCRFAFAPHPFFGFLFSFLRPR